MAKEFDDESFDSSLDKEEAEMDEEDDAFTASERAFLRGIEEEADDPSEEKVVAEEEAEY